MNRAIAAIAALVMLLSFTGCGQGRENKAEQETLPVKTVTTADPKRAIDEIYKNINIKEVTAAGDTFMTDTLGFDLSNIEEYYVRYSSGRYGLADVYIIRPTEQGYDQVRENLEAIKLERTRYTENYDVLGSHAIAENAKIFQYGNYLIMLMLEDADGATKIIEQYIPSAES